MRFKIIIFIVNYSEKPVESKPLFGSTATFGATNVVKTPSTNLFGGNTNGNSDNKPNDSPSTGFSFKLPSSTTLTPVTGNVSSAPPNSTSTPISEVSSSVEQQPAATLFGSAGGISFADLAKKTDTSVPFPTSNSLSFSALAQNSTNGTQAFSNTPSTGGFFGLSNRDTFSNLMTPQNGQNSTSNNDDGEHHTEDANYDPHYDPIIALPDEIQVSTGEENEEKIFGERAKLYRYDAENKEVCDSNS